MTVENTEVENMDELDTVTGEVIDEAPEVNEPEVTEVPDPEDERDGTPEVSTDDEPGVSKARREAAGYRTKLRAAEATNVALRDQLIGIHLGTGGVTLKALEAAGIDLATLVGEDGTVSAEAVNEAATTARTALGIPNNRFTGTADQGTRYRQSVPAAQPSWGNLIAK